MNIRQYERRQSHTIPSSTARSAWKSAWGRERNSPWRRQIAKSHSMYFRRTSGRYRGSILSRFIFSGKRTARKRVTPITKIRSKSRDLNCYLSVTPTACFARKAPRRCERRINLPCVKTSTEQTVNQWRSPDAMIRRRRPAGCRHPTAPGQTTNKPKSFGLRTDSLTL